LPCNLASKFTAFFFEMDSSTTISNKWKLMKSLTTITHLIMISS